ncbi:MAG: hypothetical protein WKF36_09425 [Candidatus Nitrosocosmicus sp.]
MEEKVTLVSIHITLEENGKSKIFKQYFGYWKNPREFATPTDTIEILNNTGSKDVQVFSNKKVQPILKTTKYTSCT